MVMLLPKRGQSALLFALADLWCVAPLLWSARGVAGFGCSEMDIV